MLTDVAKEAKLIYPSTEWEWLHLGQGCENFPVLESNRAREQICKLLQVPL